MFPIGFMYYFGVNLDSRFSVPDFWPKEGQTHRIPFERDEIEAELERLKERRLAQRARRLAIEEQGGNVEVTVHRDEQRERPKPEILEATAVQPPQIVQEAKKKGWFNWSKS